MDFLYLMHNNEPVNMEKNSELGGVRMNDFNSWFPIHGKFLVPQNVNWEVALYIYFQYRQLYKSRK